jgi:hypothetical protein
MKQLHVGGGYRPIINIEHAAPFQRWRDTGQSAFHLMHKAGLVLPVVEWNRIANASDDMRGNRGFSFGETMLTGSTAHAPIMRKNISAACAV